ncbi:MAG: hypothetical protein AB1679_10850 [Actinomycetota bacterium]
MLHDRLLGVLCLGAATLAATWGGNEVLHESSALTAKGAPPPVHADTVGPGSDPIPAPAPESTTTVTTAVPSSSTTAPPAAATSTTAPAGEPAAELARRALLVQSDVPAGFTVTSPAPPEGSMAADSPFERCVGPDAAALTKAVGARARSATFAKADTGSVSSSVVVFDQPATAEKVFGQMTTPAARSCFEGLINARLARNPRLSQDVKGSLGPAPSPAVGEAALGYRFEVRLPAEDVDATARPDDPPIRFVADFVLIRKGRTLVLAEFDNLRQPWAESALKSVAANLAAHL